ncbi:MAG TPA: hypothetical protein VI790_06250 [Candidatus Nanoarchaeia archaeon]|nr:hypothetical protein [Candidatus Nanoarchaeia archaeon]
MSFDAFIEANGANARTGYISGAMALQATSTAISGTVVATSGLAYATKNTTDWASGAQPTTLQTGDFRGKNGATQRAFWSGLEQQSITNGGSAVMVSYNGSGIFLGAELHSEVNAKVSFNLTIDGSVVRAANGSPFTYGTAEIGLSHDKLIGPIVFQSGLVVYAKNDDAGAKVTMGFVEYIIWA